MNSYEFTNNKGEKITLSGNWTLAQLVKIGITPHLGDIGAPIPDNVFVHNPLIGTDNQQKPENNEPRK
jgi:hypothetical protein